MPKDEKLLKKIDRLLKLYGVESEEERGKFIADIQDAKYDEEEHDENSLTETSQEETTETTEEVGGEQESSSEETETESTSAETEGETEEQTESEESQEEVSGGEETETESEVGEEEGTEVEETTTEEVANDSEETGSEEELTEGKEETSLDYEAKYEELKKSFDGLVARLSTLEDIVSKLGVEEKDETLGASPRADAIDESYDSTFDEINRKRVGY